MEKGYKKYDLLRLFELGLKANKLQDYDYYLEILNYKENPIQPN